MRTITLLLLASSILGCSHTRLYQVSVANKTREPITFGFVKEGDPFEPRWASPEDAAIFNAKPSAETWGAIDAGRTAVSSPIRGRFRNNAEAVLRVYEGKLDLPQILAVSRGEPNRLDLPLTPGFNAFVITDEDGHFVATRDEKAVPPPPPKQ